MADLSGLIAFGSEVLANLPEFLFIVQILVYWGFIMLFGWIVMFGYRTYSPPVTRFLARLCFGFIALVCGVSVSGLINLDVGSYRILYSFAQLDVFMGGLISSFVLLLSVYLISRNIFNINGIKKAIGRLQKRLESAEKAKGDKKLLRRPSMVAGLLIFVCYLVFALLNFQGFPVMSERVFSVLGISQGELESLMESAREAQNITDSKGGCASVMSVLQANYEKMLNNELPVYENQGTKNMIESETGSKVVMMYTAVYKGREYILAVMENEKVCSATEGRLCSCFDYGSI